MMRTALVTGSNRGIGLAVVKRLAESGVFVFAATRAPEKYPIEVFDNESKENVFPVHMELGSDSSITNAMEIILQKKVHVDYLVNNAGVYLDDPRKGNEVKIENLSLLLLEKTMRINLYAPFYLIQKSLPLMKERDFGRIVNVSSGMGRFDDLNAAGPFYRMSKTAFNALTKIVSEDVKGHNILVNAVCPGWVKTDMGGGAAPVSVEEAADGIVWACELPAKGPSGRFFRDKKELDWCRKN